MDIYKTNGVDSSLITLRLTAFRQKRKKLHKALWENHGRMLIPQNA